MKHIKSNKVLSFLLACLMLISMPGISSFAETFVNEEVHETASTVLYADGTLVINEKYEKSEYNSDTNKIVEKYPYIESGFESKEQIPWKSHFSEIHNIKFGSETKPLSMARWFSNLQNLESIDLQNLDTSETRDCTELFANTTSDFEISLDVLAECNLNNIFLNSNVNAHINTIPKKENQNVESNEISNIFSDIGE